MLFVGFVSRYHSNHDKGHWHVVKYIIKYLKRTKDYGIIYQVSNLIPLDYTDSNFHADRDKSKSTSSNVFTLGGASIAWRSVK